jgi:hypothetical protein
MHQAVTWSNHVDSHDSIDNVDHVKRLLKAGVLFHTKFTTTANDDVVVLVIIIEKGDDDKDDTGC